jgi:hypothetical protein
LLKLAGHILNRAVTRLKGDGAQGLFIVDQQFFHPLNPLQDEVAFNGNVFKRRKQGA